MNRVTLTGNACAEPTLTHDRAQVARATFRLAIPRDDRHPSDATFLNVVCWRGLAENVAASVRQGDRLTVTGWVRTERYTDEDQEVRHMLEVVATDVGLSLCWATGTLLRVDRLSTSERIA
jgi:single-strand DNA-binding protein